MNRRVAGAYSALLLLLFLLAVLKPAPLELYADPSTPPEVLRPHWYLRPLAWLVGLVPEMVAWLVVIIGFATLCGIVWMISTRLRLGAEVAGDAEGGVGVVPAAAQAAAPWGSGNTEAAAAAAPAKKSILSRLRLPKLRLAFKLPKLRLPKLSFGRKKAAPAPVVQAQSAEVPSEQAQSAQRGPSPEDR